MYSYVYVISCVCIVCVIMVIIWRLLLEKHVGREVAHLGDPGLAMKRQDSLQHVADSYFNAEINNAIVCKHVGSHAEP